MPSMVEDLQCADAKSDAKSSSDLPAEPANVSERSLAEAVWQLAQATVQLNESLSATVTALLEQNAQLIEALTGDGDDDGATGPTDMEGNPIRIT